MGVFTVNNIKHIINDPLSLQTIYNNIHNWEPESFKLIENCADKLSEPARREEIRDYRKLLNDLTGGESP
jgi:hypothetical protein